MSSGVADPISQSLFRPRLWSDETSNSWSSRNLAMGALNSLGYGVPTPNLFTPRCCSACTMAWEVFVKGVPLLRSSAATWRRLPSIPTRKLPDVHAQATQVGRTGARSLANLIKLSISLNDFTSAAVTGPGAETRCKCTETPGGARRQNSSSTSPEAG